MSQGLLAVNILQGSGATRLRYGGICNGHFIVLL